MKAFHYLLGSFTLLAASLTMAFLPRLAPTVWIFLIAGALLSGLIAGGWTLLSASAGSWPRLRTGPVLIVAGLLALTLGIVDGWWLQAAWGVVGILIGTPLWIARLTRARRQGQEPSAARRPLGRGEQF